MAFTDDFTGAAGTKLVARPGWAQIGIGSPSNGAEIDGTNQVRSASATDDVPIVGQDTASTDHYVQANVYSGFVHNGGATYSQLIVRASTRQDSVGLCYVGGNWILLSNNGSSITLVPGTFTPGALVRMEAQGNQIKVLVNGAVIITQTMTDRLSNTCVGLMAASIAGSDPVFDNYESGQLTSGSVGTAPTGVFSKVQADGDSVVVEIDTTNTPTAGTVSLPVASSNPGGAVAQSAINLTLTAGKATATFTNVPAGSYGTPVATLTNASGSNTATGGNGVTIMGVTMPTGDTEAPILTGTGTASVTSTTATVTCPIATDNVGVAGYEYSVSGTTTFTNIGGTRTANIQNLTPDTTYAATFRAYDQAGNRSAPWSIQFKTAAVAVPPPVKTKPDAPTNVIASVDGVVVTVSFLAPANNGGSPVISYQVKASTGQTADVDASPATLTMPAGVPVSFTVFATNEVGTSVESSVSNVVTPAGVSVPDATYTTADAPHDRTIKL